MLSACGSKNVSNNTNSVTLVSPSSTTPATATATASPEPSEDIKTMDDAEKEMATALIKTASIFLEKGENITEDLREQAFKVITDSTKWVSEANRSKFVELANYIRADDREGVQKTYQELITIYGEPSSTNSAVSTPSPSPSPKPPVEQPITLSGKGDQASEFFELHSGFAVINATSTGDSNFIVHMLDESGQNEESLINEIGTYKGKSFVMIPSDGKYMLNVESEGSWTAKITQTVPANIKSAPTKLTGKGNDVVFVNLQAKLTKFSFKHVGESNFIVHVNDGISLVNEIGNYSGSTAKTVDSDGIYIFSVEADGQWSINIE